jgi:PadR family transcriptional regulator PadR
MILVLPGERWKILSEVEGVDKKFQKELHGGITALVLLGVLGQATEPMYGYQIAKLIEGDQDELAGKQGVLYPVLRSLEGSGMLESKVEPSVSGPPRRYYWITELGRSTLERWQTIWGQTKNFVDAVLKGTLHDEARK